MNDTRKNSFGDAAIRFAIFALNLVLIAPFLGTAYSDQPWNNGYIYTAIAKVFREARWTWNPAQFNGAPFNYLYPPLFHTLVAYMPVHSIGRSFHLVTGIGYALIPVALYCLAEALFESRLVALFAAVAYSVSPSPAYLMTVWHNNAIAYHQAPWGFVALIGYEEAAHAVAFPFALWALAAAWRGRFRLAGILAAAVFLTNWPAMIGLCMMLAALLVARRCFEAAIGIGGVAYGLSAFWMTPGYFVSSSLLNRIVLRHTLTAAPFTWVTWLILLIAAALVAAAWLRKVPANVALPLTLVAVSGAVVVSFTLVGNYLVPSPHRYMLEFNAGCILLLAAGLSYAPRWLSGVAIVAAVAISLPFLNNAWKVQRPRLNPETTVAYQITDWFNRNAPHSRALVAGELDSTFALWSPELRQIGGSGVSNFLVWAAQRQVTFGCGAGSGYLAELWLRALGDQYLVVHEGPSREFFHWHAEPEKFRVMKTAWDNGEGDRIYESPVQPEAVVVDLNALRALPPMKSTADVAFLESYLAWSAGKRPAQLRWNSVDSGTIDADGLAPDEAILIRTTWDRGWRAPGAMLTRDPLGFMLIAGKPHVELRYGRSWEAWLGVAITLITVFLLRLNVPKRHIAAIAIIPAVLAYAVLLPGKSPEEEAFVRLQPPFINPGGIVDAGKGLVSAYAANLGQHPKVYLDDREAEVVSHGPQVVTFRKPAAAGPDTIVSVEADGCRGNAFKLGVK